LLRLARLSRLGWSRGELPDAARRHFAFRIRSGGAMEVRFKDIRLEVLPLAETPKRAPSMP